MKDVEKTNVQRENSSKRMRRRRRKMNLYGLIVVLLVLTVGITISYTFLFNISEIRVGGESDQYTAEEIVNASGISKGDNLLRLNTRKSEQNILDALLYIETADVDRDFPSSLEITVSKCIPAFNIPYETGTLLVSRKGKILADNGFITEGLPIFYGFDPSETTPGKQLVSSDAQKDEAFRALSAQINSSEENLISSIDMSDKYEILVNYSNGIIFKMGNWTDIEYKLNLAQNVMNDDSVKGKSGYITMIGSNQCSFRDSDEPVDNSAFTPTESATDENGIPIGTGAQVSGTDSESAEPSDTDIQRSEYDPEEEELFREHNERENPDEENIDDD